MHLSRRRRRRSEGRVDEALALYRFHPYGWDSHSYRIFVKLNQRNRLPSLFLSLRASEAFRR